MSNDIKEKLKLLREPFAEHQISKLPKPTKQQTEEVRADFKKGIRCAVCGGWHHPNVIHLDYVGHAALTDRLLDCDPCWTWEPLALNSEGYPVIDNDGGMWIKLTVCGVTRLGYGDAQGKTGGDAMKERIGDALRNAAMRFGAALDLWHKGDLHIDEPETKKIKESAKSITVSVWDKLPEAKQRELQGYVDAVREHINNGDISAAVDEFNILTDADERTAAWSRFGSSERSAMTKENDRRKGE